ncbi:large ribosomal subunit protein uL24m-like [Halichondria panicea]|uniref:large ribosomal subunit protein uL24m-like n=1 Tax=Halichondria panicea TaxID=6063 RepID=UPI00312B72BE
MAARWRPWTTAAKAAGRSRSRKPPPEPLKKWNIVRGDLVQILAGKDKGVQGKVAAVIRKENRVIVGGFNTHIRVRSLGEGKTIRVASEAPLHVSNVALVDPGDGQPCRIKYQYTEDGEKVRVSRRSGMIVPKPPELKERKDLPSRSAYLEGGQDTLAEDVTERTYIPSLLSFEEEIAQLIPREPPQSPELSYKSKPTVTEQSSISPAN